MIEITFFVPDERKAGGKQSTISGKLRRINKVFGLLEMTDRRMIPLQNVRWLAGDALFEEEKSESVDDDQTSTL